MKASKKVRKKDKRDLGTNRYTDTQIGKKLMKRAIQDLMFSEGSTKIKLIRKMNLEG